jgi:hypothetical protein
LKVTVWLLPGFQPTPATKSPLPLQEVEQLLTEFSVMQADPVPTGGDGGGGGGPHLAVLTRSSA